MRQLLGRLTDFERSDVEILLEAKHHLPLIASLNDVDAYIDVLTKDNHLAVVVAQFCLPGGTSYKYNLVGDIMLRKNEPGVYRTLELGVPSRELKAVVSENNVVRQSAAAITNREGRIIGALVTEKKTTEIAEIHHRVKNNLQNIISLIGLQANRSQNAEVKAFSQEIISRIFSISLTHELLAHNGVDHTGINDLIRKLINSSMNFIIPENLDLTAEVSGDEILLDSDKATNIALVVNELIQNAIKHAFIGREKGKITVAIERGIVYSNIIVSDDGVGFGGSEHRGLGLNLVSSLVNNKLKGSLDIASDGSGTRVKLTFITENDII
jgi:two-component sensor histidine kinase